MVLVTMDKHFYKQAMKYNAGMAILIPKVQHTNHNYSPRQMAIKIEQGLENKYKELKEYYKDGSN